MGLRFLHVSDIHLLDLRGVSPWRFLNKRITGAINLALVRGRQYDGRLFDEVLVRARELSVDRLVITGDLTNLALESEFRLCREKLDHAGVPVTVIPGNHDTYTRGSARARRFEEYLSHHMEGDRPNGAAYYPFVQRFDDTALVGVSTAIATLPAYATGRVGHDQLAHVDQILRALGEDGFFRVVLIHHPVVEGVARPRHELIDLAAFGAVIQQRGAELILHGHEHTLYEGTLPGPDGPVPVHGLSAGTALSRAPKRRASFSVYDVAPGRLERQLYCWTGTEFRALA
jgi:3',5'-cyclic AMP phosphodiesterase CpdA